MKNSTLLICILLALAVVLAVSYLSRQTAIQQEETTEVQPAPEPAPAQEKKTIVHYPVPAPQPVEQQPTPVEPKANTAETNKPEPELPEVLPKVQNSDESIADALKSLIPDMQLYKILRLENFIQRLVSTIDSLPEKQLPQHILPVNPPGESFTISNDKGSLSIAQENAQRYSPYMQILKYAPQDLVIEVYVHFYQLFQEAYKQLGYQNSYFNDRLVFVIDHLLQTPDPADPLALEQPVILYTFADPALENLSAGQKTLLRLGREQRLEVVEILRSYRLKFINLEH
jgi:hypothetical protein